MAAKEMYDYLSVVTADNNQTLNVSPSKVMTEIGTKNQVIHLGDDGSEERVSLSNDSIFYVTLQWDLLSAADSGTLVQFYHDATYGNGIAESFKWTHPTDGHTYVIRFDSDLNRELYLRSWFGILNVKFKVLGTIVDA